MTAFEKFGEIDKLPTIQDKHRTWLKDYEGKQFGISVDGKNWTEWKGTKYKNSEWNPQINLVGRLKNRTVIEFDGDEKKAKDFLDETEKKLIKMDIGFIRSTHRGKSDYLWVEFTRDMQDKEVERFLMWIAPEGSEIDLNFASSKRIFPVMYAVHRKHSYYREMPIKFVEGKQIDYDSLKINPKEHKRVISGDGYTTAKVFTRKGQAEVFIENQPLFYDKSGLWWIWNKKDNFWELTDDVDILNMLEDSIGADIISSKSRNEILNSLKQVGRKQTPLSAPKSWVQFKNGIVDINNPNSIFIPSSSYFITNPIPWDISDNEETPTIERIFEQWVGSDYVQTLYEIIAYCLYPDYNIHRIFCFIGAGLNGKSCFLNLLRKFIGNRNVTSTELDVLLNSRFEITRLYKKLVCQMGETNFSEMNKTSILKKLSGNDLIGFEYKNKNPFEDRNYAKIIISTNNLPSTTDKTIGFYRRWTIVDFPNQFTEKKDILQDIPEIEYSNLARKSVKILNKLLSSREFSNEGSIEERIKRYEDRSDPLEKFFKEFVEEDVDGTIWKFEFEKRLNQWCREKRFRQIAENTIGRKMKEKGINQTQKMSDWFIEGTKKTLRAWTGIKWKQNNSQVSQEKQVSPT